MSYKIGQIIPCEIDCKNMTLDEINKYPDLKIRSILKHNYRSYLLRYINPFIPKKMIIKEQDLSINQFVEKIHEYLNTHAYAKMTMVDKVDIVLGKKNIEDFKKSKNKR